MTDTTHQSPSSNGKSSTAQKTSQVLAEKADEFRDTAETVVKETVAQAQESMGDVQQSLVKAGEKARKVTEEQPLMVVAGALAIGVVLGMALSNRRS